MMRLFSSPRYTATIGDHIMPIRKFDLVREAVLAAGLDVRVEEPSIVADDDLRRVHTEAYVHAVATGEPRALAESQKLPWSPGLAESVRWTNGGCVAALDAALEDGVAGNLASGFHHAHADHGEGFCTFHGLVVALERARAQGRIERGLVIDLDLHYGNGTAALLATRPHLHALSIYGSWYADNKAHREVLADRAPDTDNAWSVPVPNGSCGATYLELIESNLGFAIDRARPDVLYYQAGADPYREDPYSPLDVGVEDLLARDRLIFATARARGLPIAWVLAGGYTRDVSKVVEIHVNTARAAVSVFSGATGATPPEVPGAR